MNSMTIGSSGSFAGLGRTNWRSGCCHLLRASEARATEVDSSAAVNSSPKAPPRRRPAAKSTVAPRSSIEPTSCVLPASFHACSRSLDCARGRPPARPRPPGESRRVRHCFLDNKSLLSRQEPEKGQSRRAFRAGSVDWLRRLRARLALRPAGTSQPSNGQKRTRRPSRMMLHVLTAIALCRSVRYMNSPDPVTLSVLDNRLRAIVEEMGEAMLRTSYSQILNSSRDFSTALWRSRPPGRASRARSCACRRHALGGEIGRGSLRRHPRATCSCSTTPITAATTCPT